VGGWPQRAAHTASSRLRSTPPPRQRLFVYGRLLHPPLETKMPQMYVQCPASGVKAARARWLFTVQGIESHSRTSGCTLRHGAHRLAPRLPGLTQQAVAATRGQGCRPGACVRRQGDAASGRSGDRWEPLGGRRHKKPGLPIGRDIVWASFVRSRSVSGCLLPMYADQPASTCTVTERTASHPA
jgi:hypothetical protein